MNLFAWLTLKKFPAKINYKGKDYFLMINQAEYDDKSKMIWMVTYSRIYSFIEAEEIHKNKSYGFGRNASHLTWEHHILCADFSLSKCIGYMKKMLKEK